MTLLIGGIVCCGECPAVFGSLHEYELHAEMMHEAGPDDPDDYWGKEDACYAEGVRTGRP